MRVRKKLNQITMQNCAILIVACIGLFRIGESDANAINVTPQDRWPDGTRGSFQAVVLLPTCGECKNIEQIFSTRVDTGTEEYYALFGTRDCKGISTIFSPTTPKITKGQIKNASRGASSFQECEPGRVISIDPSAYLVPF